jgi:hypothetical protein
MSERTAFKPFMLLVSKHPIYRHCYRYIFLAEDSYCVELLFRYKMWIAPEYNAVVEPEVVRQMLSTLIKVVRSPNGQFHVGAVRTEGKRIQKFTTNA